MLSAGSSVKFAGMPGWDLRVAGDPPSCWLHGGGRRRPSGTDRAPGETTELVAGSTKEASENKLQACGAGSWMPRAARFRRQYWLYWQGIGWRWAPRDGAESRNLLMDAS